MTTPIKLLILEDREADARLVLHELKQAGFAADWTLAGDEPSFVSSLTPPPDVIVADYCLPQYDALRALQLLRARGMDIPFIIVSGSIGEDTAVAAMRQGAADYLLKDRLARLGEAIRQALEQKRLRDEKRRVEDALRESERSLKEASRRKDEFLATLAHELRNPLAPIRNGLQIMKLSPSEPHAVEHARLMIERQVVHLGRMVDDLLDASRLTRGKITLRVERLDLARHVRVTAEDHRPAFDEAGVTLGVETPEVPVWVTADPTRLTQVLDNLLQNALKFTKSGGTVGVRLKPDGEHRQAWLTVWDTGEGIDPDMLPKLFQVFTQADRSLDRSKGGLGLGLAVVKGLTELHGGQVHADSAGLGQGAEFTVSLPTDPEPGALSQIPTQTPRAKCPLRVLVVEDNRDSAESLRMLLNLYGHEVAVAHSGPEGVKTAEECRPDVVLCDIGLPGMDGYSVARALRRNPSTAATRMIAVTGYGNDGDRGRSQEAGFDEHLTKPVDPEALICVLARSSN